MKNYRKPINLLTALMIMTAWSSPGFAASDEYKEIEVKDGGAISGAVLFKGNAPPPIMQDLKKGKNSEFCSTHPDSKDGVRPIYKVKVSDGKLSGAVVFIEEISGGKAWSKEPTRFDFKLCDIYPRVSVVRKPMKGEKDNLVVVENQDENILHNPHGYSVKGAQRGTLFNKPLPSKGAVADVTQSLKRFKEGKDGHFFLQCDQHNFMEADARIVWNPYYSVTGDNGAFTLENVPAGKYKVTAWHPYAGESTVEVTVGAGGTAKADFTLAAK